MGWNAEITSISNIIMVSCAGVGNPDKRFRLDSSHPLSKRSAVQKGDLEDSEDTLTYMH